MAQDSVAETDGRFALPMWQGELPEGLDERERAVAERLAAGPLRLSDTLGSRLEGPTLARLVTRGAVMIGGVTPSDAAHVLNRHVGGVRRLWAVSAYQRIPLMIWSNALSWPASRP